MTGQPNSEVVVLNAALELRAAERAAYLDQACAGDAALRQQVEALLRAHDQAEEFLVSPPAGLDFNRTVKVNIPLTEKSGDRIGRYKLLQQIGEGGCGVVYMAEQEEPVKRRVALKIIKLGMDTKQVIARFEAERQALALMDHPNIAKVLDAGATETGRPYFVMELVRGIKITEFCDQNKVPTEERLRLFMQVCQAIQHAHQKGVIHRDIKPSNILVTINEPGSPGIPKVIDFGIAKATAGRLTDQTLFTAFEQFIGTPAYMSPEQAVMTALDIDTRSDVYSLGVLLYELLTGKTPFDQKELLASGLDEMRRTILEREPLKPSTRLNTMVEVELTTTAKHQQTEPPKLVHLVRGDLDWIVMKCLEKDRSRRYETANGVAADIHRHLQDEPITARPPSQLYRFQKSVQRNKLAFGAATAVVLALVFSLVVSIWLFVRERQIRQIQERLREQAEIVNANQAALLRKAEVREKIAEAKTLYDGRRYDEAEGLLNAIDPSLIGPDSMHAAVRRSLAWRRLVQNQWTNAVAHLAVLVQVDGMANAYDVAADHCAYATALLETGDKEGYRRFRQSLVERYAGVADPAIAEIICRTSLLLPADNALKNAMSALQKVAAQRRCRRDGSVDPKAWNHLSLALVDYRRGDYSNAQTRCVGTLAPPSPQESARIPAALIMRAMVHWQLHQQDDAQVELAYAKEAIGSFFRKELPENTWPDWVSARLLLREATALIPDQPSLLKITPFDANRKVRAARNLLVGRRLKDAQEKVSDLPAVAIEMEAQDAQWLYGDLALQNLVAQRRQQAAQYLQIALLGPNDEGSLLPAWDVALWSLSLGPLLIELGDYSTYGKLRTALVAATADTDDPGTAERTLKACVLLPIDAELKSQLNPLAEVLRHTTAASSSWYSWANLARGLFEYRRGNFAEAVQLVPKDPQVDPPKLRPVLKATAQVITAMALFQLHRQDEANLELAQCRDLIVTNLSGPLDLGTPTADTKGIVGPWHDWWIAHILLCEADTLINSNSIIKTENTPEPQ